MNPTLARSILVLFATSALGACATPTYATNLAQAAPQGGEPVARLTPAVQRGGEPAELILAATHRRHHAATKAADAGDAPASYTVKKGDTLARIADKLGVGLAELKAANHVKGTSIDVGQVLTVPGATSTKTSGKSSGKHAAAAAADEAPADRPASYKVRKGDTLAKVADKLGVGVTELKQANRIKGVSIHAGQVLKVPNATSTKTSGMASARHAATTDEDAGDQPASYKVSKGDTLAKVADKLGVSVAELKQANHIKRASIHAGQVLKVPGKAAVKSASRAERAAPETPATYKVRHGDTLFSIASRFGVGVEDLRAANRLSRHASLHTGQTLKLSAADAVQDEAPARASKASARRRAAEAEAYLGESGPAAGRVVEIPGAPATYRVRKGDTLDKVADKLGTDVARLKKDNRLKGSTIRPGQVLKGPRTASKPAYVARSGDTLADISRRFGVSTEKLRAANGLSRRARIRSGEKIVLPVGYRDHGATSAPARERTPPLRFTPLPLPSAAAPAPSNDEPQSTAPAEGPSTTVPPTTTAPRPYTPTPYTPTPSTPRSYAPPATTNGPPLAPTAAPPPTDAQISELGRGRFLWPLKGQILSDFGPKTPGQRNDGINIQASAGDAVRAAAAGDVVYAGDQVPGFGNLVLVKHADGWVTAYGHLSKVEVKMQQKVAQGQEIGQAGTTGGVTDPQLHFEVRYAPNPLERARPIDPKLVLPR